VIKAGGSAPTKKRGVGGNIISKRDLGSKKNTGKRSSEKRDGK